MIWRCRGREVDLSRQGMIMGIVNVTPDSFSDGGQHFSLDAAVRHAFRLVEQGAEILDIGGESTRPGAAVVAAAEEVARVLPVIRALRSRWNGLISVDTTKAEVAAAALASGVDIVNDVSGLRFDAEMPRLCAQSGCGVVVMHMRGTPQTMQIAPSYSDVVEEVKSFFSERRRELMELGIANDCMAFDPGIGFGKTLEHNLALLRRLGEFAQWGRPLVLGVSRKSVIGQSLGDQSMALRDWPTVAVTAQARLAGVVVHRVHDVLTNREAVRMIEAIMQG